MKIAMYVPVWPAGLEQANGVVTYASYLVPALRRLGHEVYVVTMKSNDPDDPYTIELKKFDEKLPFWHRILFRVLPSLAGLVENLQNG